MLFVCHILPYTRMRLYRISVSPSRCNVPPLWSNLSDDIKATVYTYAKLQDPTETLLF